MKIKLIFSILLFCLLSILAFFKSLHEQRKIRMELRKIRMESIYIKEDLKIEDLKIDSLKLIYLVNENQ